jgi:hypothetical protein
MGLNGYHVKGMAIDGGRAKADLRRPYPKDLGAG